MTRAGRARRIVAAALYGGGGLGALSAAAYGVIYGETKLARRRIKPPTQPPPNAEGIWTATGPAAESAQSAAPRSARHDPGRTGARSARAPRRGGDRPLVLAIIGDSSAAGLGVHEAARTPAAVMAGRLSGLAGRPVRVISSATVGARSADLAAQIDQVLARAPQGRVDVAVVMIGANDVTHRVKPADSIRLLSAAVQRLTEARIPVVVGTCPDLGTIKPIAQPLRLIARRMSRSLAAAQTIAVVEAGGRTVSLGDLLGPHFAVRRDWFSDDGFHPSAAGYRVAAEAILPSVLACLDLPTETAPASRFTGRRPRPIAAAAARAAAHPGTEVAGAQVDGERFGSRGRWARLLRRGADDAAQAAAAEGTAATGSAEAEGADAAPNSRSPR